MVARVDEPTDNGIKRTKLESRVPDPFSTLAYGQGFPAIILQQFFVFLQQIPLGVVCYLA